MELSEIGRLCLRCMKVSEDEEICPYCGKEKKGQQTWSKALAPGTILNNKIIIGNILGKGGYGITYIGYDLLLEYRVAIKEFFPDEMVDRSEDGKTVLVLDEVNDEEYQKETTAYLREARVLAEFSKFPGIVAIKDLFYENNTGYLIMEYLENGNLRKYIDNHGGWLGVDETLKLMEPVISILGKLHKSDLIHRDISPDNIMMDEDGSVKLIDFGGSKKIGFNNQQVFLGKWGFAPLEQMLSKLSEQGPWTDIYGICATLYCMMTGDVPPASYERNEKDEIININDYTINIDKKIGDAIMKGLSMEISKRQQSIEELYRDLYGALPDEKGSHGSQAGEEAGIMRDQAGNIWLGEYPMNEVMGAQITSDIIYGDYNQDNVAVVGGKKYLRLPVYKEINSSGSDKVFMVKRPAPEVVGYRYFEFNMLSWKVLQQRNNRLTLMTEYVIDYRLYDLDKYQKMNDKEISKIRTGINWERSKIREWLNSTFVRRAFTEKERSLLQVTEVNTPVSALSDRITYDKVYLPSIAEIRYGFAQSHAIQREKKRDEKQLENIPCSQYVAAISNGGFQQIGYGLRSRGHIDVDGSYVCQECGEGHSITGPKFTPWMLNKSMGIRPVICILEEDITDMT